MTYYKPGPKGKDLKTCKCFNMTAVQIRQKLREKFPEIYCTGPIHCIALPGEDNYNEYWIETNEVPEQHNILGKGRTEKKAWVAAWNKFNDPDFDQQQFEKDCRQAELQKKRDKEYIERRKRIEELPDDTMFYWQSYGYIGNCPNLWALGGSGYTTKLEKAQMYNKTETLKQLACRRDHDKFYTTSDMTAAAKLMVDHQDLSREQQY